MDEITINREIAAEKSFAACRSTDENSSEQHDEKHEMLLTLPKSDIFVDDQTPTPTRLIRNCEEVGLFDDLRHVNPFEETFRRAVEQNAGQTPTTATPAASHTEDDTLHTPQVFAQLEEPIVDGSFRSDDLLQKPLETLSALDVPVIEDLVAVTGSTDTDIVVPVTRHISLCDAKAPKYRLIAEKQTTVAASMQSSYPHLQPTITLIQPQVITLSFPSSSDAGTSRSVAAVTAIPVQTVKPFILPKATATCAGMQQSAQLATFVTNTTSEFNSLQSHHEPSSASLTPTSQLPIKERLKAILSQGSKSSSMQLPLPRKCCKRRDTRAQSKYSEDCVERRRAAATRYRNKMRNEHTEVRQHNIELKQENMKLRERVRQLEQQLAHQNEKALLQPLDSGTESAQVQIPASTLHLVMNIPKMVMSAIGQPMLQNPITYRLEKK